MPDTTANHNQDSLRELIRLITFSQGEFSLILAVGNYGVLRRQISEQLQEQCSIPIRELVLEQSVKTLYTTIVEELGLQQPEALMVSGIDSVSCIEEVLTATNQIREEFRNFRFPLVLWVTDKLLQMLIRSVPDFHSWSSCVEFLISSGQLIHFIKQSTDQVFAKVVASRETEFLHSSTLNLNKGSASYVELQSARQELEKRGVALAPELEASLEFVLGRVADNSQEESRQHYERSLALWKQTDNRERRGHVLFCLGLWWAGYGLWHQAEKEQACEQAKVYFQESVEGLEQANRLDLAAKYINFWGDTLQRQSDWEQLKTVAEKALALHQTYSDPFRMARAYGFLAEVALAKSAFKKAQEYSKQALFLSSTALEKIVNPSPEQQTFLDWHKSFAQGWYLFSLGRALLGTMRTQNDLGQLQAALHNLETARAETKPHYDPELYIGILKELHQVYCQQGDYLKAFNIKQVQQGIESRFGFRAFIGAGRLQPKQQITNPVLATLECSKTIAPEIAASGREHHINHLIERMKQERSRLTVIHGQSGAGKSSMIEAGLIPALERQTINTRRVLPVLQRVYRNWIQALGKSLTKTLDKRVNLTSVAGNLDSTALILEQLRKNARQNLLTVLIFDQFEEFLSVCSNPNQRRCFYEFLRYCLNIPYVKVILSMREDYLHWLLECNKFGIDLEVINNNILDKRILFHLGNLTPADAKLYLQRLTEQAQFPLEQALIDKLVEDLGKELGEIRPIELQVVGAQLERNQITTLEHYQHLGHNPKAELVNQYLEEVVEACGSENKRVAELVLYLLTDENNTRPLKTRHDLEKELKALAADVETELKRLDLVLEIFWKSGLVLLLREFYGNRYQLVHDYLVDFIRQRKGADIIAELKADIRAELEKERAELEKEREARQRLRKSLLTGLGGFSVVITILAIVIWQLQSEKFYQRQATLAKLNAKYQLYRLVNKNQLDALLISIKGGKRLNHKIAKSDIEQETLSNLWEAVNLTQEHNRLDGHKESVLSVSVSPDNQLIASASSDQTIKLWSRDGQLLNSLEGHDDTVWCVSFSPDNQIIASASKDKTVKLWSRDGTLINTLTGHDKGVKWVSFSPDGQTIASASGDKTVKLWKLDGTLLKTLTEHQDAVLSVSFSNDGELIASASKDKTVKLWSRDGRLINTLRGHDEGVNWVSFSPDGQTIASASDDQTVNLWNRDGTLRKPLAGHDDAINSVSFSPDGELIASGSSDGKIKLWSGKGTAISTLPGHKDIVNQVSFTPDGKMLASASFDLTVKLWSLDQTLPKVFQPTTYTVYGYGASFSPDGEIIASGSRDDYTVRLWNPEKQIRELTLEGHQDFVNGVDFSPDGQLIATASDDKTVKLWNRQGKLLHTLEGHSAPVYSVSFSPDSQIIASASEDSTVKLWTREGKLLRTLAGHKEAINRVSFSPDGQLIASASNDKTVKLWKQGGTLITTLTGPRKLSSVSFSPDGKRIVAGAAGGFLVIWTGTDISWQQFESERVVGHTKTVHDVSFHPHRNIIASASADGTVKLWDPNGILIRTLTEGSERVESVNFSPDGETLVSINAANRVSIWNLDYSQFLGYSQLNDVNYLLKRACDQIGNYLKNNLKVKPKNKKLCEGIEDQE
ncbi:sugar-binding protein [Moorena sp. SIO4G3]|uniref:WD40 domain-containing protein n=1 Tax=Moorena sp. SIO4G3 TaxID=2607821 RepID=UPI00142A1A04|nr:sugar-binding protein [Moorena sp. SIO4G3]NEO80635.1 sugar-binding protein [Moorena sp. SIO4G3]